MSDGPAGRERPGRRRPSVGAVILALFLVVPIVELALAIQVGRWIGALPTILLLIFESLLGAWIVKREGVAAWRALAASAQSGRPPARELADAVLVLIGGTLLLTPGFLTDVVGFLFVIPVTRPLVRGPVTRWLGRAVARRVVSSGPFVTFGGFPPGTGAGFPPGAQDGVVQGEVVDVDVEVRDLPRESGDPGPETPRRPRR